MRRIPPAHNSIRPYMAVPPFSGRGRFTRRRGAPLPSGGHTTPVIWPWRRTHGDTRLHRSGWDRPTRAAGYATPPWDAPICQPPPPRGRTSALDAPPHCTHHRTTDCGTSSCPSARDRPGHTPPPLRMGTPHPCGGIPPRLRGTTGATEPSPHADGPLHGGDRRGRRHGIIHLRLHGAGRTPPPLRVGLTRPRARIPRGGMPPRPCHHPKAAVRTRRKIHFRTERTAARGSTAQLNLCPAPRLHRGTRLRQGGGAHPSLWTKTLNYVEAALPTGHPQSPCVGPSMRIPAHGIHTMAHWHGLPRRRGEGRASLHDSAASVCSWKDQPEYRTAYSGPPHQPSILHGSTLPPFAEAPTPEARPNPGSPRTHGHGTICGGGRARIPAHLHHP